MIVYHGSWLEVKNPDLKHSRSDVDFGKGFYVTPLRDLSLIHISEPTRLREGSRMPSSA